MQRITQICLGMTGSLRSFQVIDFIRLLKAEHCDSVSVLMTDAAATMLKPEIVRLAADEVITGWHGHDHAAPHVEIPLKSDIFAVLPATANTICKAAAGICDTNVLAAVSVSPKPVIFAPAMNAHSWSSGPVRRAVKQLRVDGHCVIDPVPGYSVTENRAEGGMIAPESDILATFHHMVAKSRAVARR